MTLLTFAILAFLSVLAAIMMITARKIVFSVFWLLLSFFTTACILLLLKAEFLAVVQILVNAGAVIISFLFVVILINLREEPKNERYHQQTKWAVLVSAILFVLVGLLLVPQGRYYTSEGMIASELVKWGGNSELVAKYLFSDYILPFEVVALVLLVAIIGVVVLAKKMPPKQKAE
ncbi:MAG: NADH-quinone oxidoreductase subunit J [Candidatus Schekmanbacteria bacterium]|nr:NADH-quinone oxidoreductase subunit J [Candidatus Schekmanbacteria bacterium]